MRPGRIIFLNGTSSSGKSTLAHALRDRLEEPFCYYASDQLADSGFRTTKVAMRDLGQPDERQRFFDGFHRSIPAFAEAGNDLLVEHIIEQQGWADQLAKLLAHLDVFWIGVHAPKALLEKRERERGNREIGEALFHLKTHSFCRYDIEISTKEPLDLSVAAIIDAWKNRTGRNRADARPE